MKQKKVRILVSFVGRVNGVKYSPAAGTEMMLPKGADWIEAGLAEEIKSSRSRSKKSE